MIGFCKIFYVSFIKLLVLFYFLYRYFIGSDPNVLTPMSFVNFAIERPLADFSPTTNRNPQGQFHIQFFWNFRIFTFFKKKNGKVEQSKPYRQNLSYVIFVIFLALWPPTPVLRYPAASRPLLPVSKPRKTAAGQGIYIQWVHTLRTILCRGRYAREDTSALCAL